jgi:3-dehydroquinate synthase
VLIREVLVRTADGADYPVRVGPGALAELPLLLEERVGAHRYALIGDRRVVDHHGEAALALVRDAGMPVDAFTFPPGEARKNREEWARLTDALLAAGIGRDGCVLALGGGVTGDLAGFVAATYMRGIPAVQIPTSLVAMMDASVGGKTGVDVPRGKNLVGAFHPPRFVLADTRLARTLPVAERRQGLAEAVKHGAILDPDYLARIHGAGPALLAGDEEATAEAVARSVEIKAEVVGRDEREGGMRQVLNFGHTLAHALEAASGYGLAHGSAVAVGMVLEARLGEAVEVTDPGTADRIEEVLSSLGLPTRPDPGVDPERVVELLVHDKKARGGEPRFVLLDGIGRVHAGTGGTIRWAHPVPTGVVREVLAAGAAPAI